MIGRGFGNRTGFAPTAVPERTPAARRWLGRLGLLILAGAGAGFAASRFEPVARASAAPLDQAEARDAAALAISPLAYGADTGRRMAPGAAVEPLLDKVVELLGDAARQAQEDAEPERPWSPL